MIRKYYDLHISVQDESVADIINLAEKLEFSGIGLTINAETKEQIDSLKNEINTINTKLDVLVAVSIRAENPEILRKKIEKFREHVDLIIVEGGDIAVNRAACENPKVDILSHPSSNRKDSGMDHVMAKLAHDNRVAIELNLRTFLHSYSKIRVHILSHMQENVVLVKHAGADIIVTSGAKSIWDMRAGRELSTLAIMCGIDREKAVMSVSDTPRIIADRIRSIKKYSHIMAGVKTIKK